MGIWKENLPSSHLLSQILCSSRKKLIFHSTFHVQNNLSWDCISDIRMFFHMTAFQVLWKQWSLPASLPTGGGGRMGESRGLGGYLGGGSGGACGFLTRYLAFPSKSESKAKGMFSRFGLDYQFFLYGPSSLHLAGHVY